MAKMTDIVERLRIGRETCGVDMCRIREAKSGCTCAEAADEIERLREALWEIAKTDTQTWASAALVKDDWSIVERIAEVDQQGVAHRALLGVKARAALGEKE